MGVDANNTDLKRGETLMNELHCTCANIRTGIEKLTFKKGAKEMLLHISGVGHLEVLTLARGQVPIKGDPKEWMKTAVGKAAEAEKKANAACNELENITKTLVNARSGARGKPDTPTAVNYIKETLKRVIGGIENWANKNKWPVQAKLWVPVERQIKEAKAYANS
jgi:hypothetical protein